LVFSLALKLENNGHSPRAKQQAKAGGEEAKKIPAIATTSRDE
jgi:hypothetical protein